MLVNQMLSMKAGKTQPGLVSEKVLTIAPDATIAEAVKMLSERRFGALVVSSDGKRPEGILSERDIVRELGKKGAEILSKAVHTVMTRDISTCLPGDDAMDVLSRMTEGRFRHLPVVNAAGDMIGIVSIGDAVFARLKELNDEKDALTGMIMGS